MGDGSGQLGAADLAPVIFFIDNFLFCKLLLNSLKLIESTR